MSSLLESIAGQLGGQALGGLAGKLGADPATTQGAVSAALPMLLGALAKNAGQPGGADALHAALEQHDGSVLQNLGGALSSGALQGQGASILGHLFGGGTDAVAANLGNSTGLDAGAAKNLLASLAPVVMGALGRARNAQGLDAGGLASLLGDHQQQMAAQAPQAHSLITALLDRNGDGSVADDVAKAGMGLLGSFFKR